jgi:hypothetical protein
MGACWQDVHSRGAAGLGNEARTDAASGAAGERMLTLAAALERVLSKGERVTREERWGAEGCFGSLLHLPHCCHPGCCGCCLGIWRWVSY